MSIHVLGLVLCLPLHTKFVALTFSDILVDLAKSLGSIRSAVTDMWDAAGCMRDVRTRRERIEAEVVQCEDNLSNAGVGVSDGAERDSVKHRTNEPVTSRG